MAAGKSGRTTKKKKSSSSATATAGVGGDGGDSNNRDGANNPETQEGTASATTTAADLLFTTIGCNLCVFKFKQKTRAAFLEGAKTRRKKQFGIDYTNLLLASSSAVGPSKSRVVDSPMLNAVKRRKCLKDAKKEIREIDRAIAECYDSIDRKVGKIEVKSAKKEKKKKKKKIKRDQSNKLPKRASQRHLQSPKVKKGMRKIKRPMSDVDLSLTPEEFQGGDIDRWTSCQWKCEEVQFNGNWSSTTTGKVEKIQGKSIDRGVEKFREYPQLFVAIFYPTEMLSWPENEQEYTLIYRDGTTGLKPKGVKKSGKATFMMHHYQPLPSMDQDLLPQKHHDKYTSAMSYKGQKLVTKNRKALLPGRGMGLVDNPTLKIIGDVDPSDIAQGQCGNCWLLSGITSLAE